MKGIDISMHNGTVDFNKVKEAGISAVYIKATEGVSYVDPSYKTYLNGIKNTGLLYGMYHFMSEKTSPTQQAIDFYNAIKDTGYTLIPCLDIESNTLGRTATEITDRCLEFLNKFYELTKQECVIYTGGYFGRDMLDSRIKGYKAWIAHYGVSTPMKTGFSNVVGHQYTEEGSVKGINGNVDLNNFTDEIKLVDSRIDFKITLVANIQSIGLKKVTGINSCTIGTEGKSLRLEMFAMNIDGIDFTYMVHIEKIGDVSGIEGQSLGSIDISRRIEGLQINVKSIPDGYVIRYRCHLQSTGWTSWCKSGEYCGTRGKYLRLEAIEVEVVKA